MNRTLLFTALFALAGVVSAHDGRDIDKVNGGITAEANTTYGDLSTVNGGIDIGRGVRADDVETVNGGIEAEDDVSVDSASTVNGGIRFGKRARIDDSVETVNGSIFIDRGSRVRHGVSTVNGAIGLVGTDVGGDIETVNGNVTVSAGSHVAGGLRVRKPSQGGLNIRIGKPRVPRIVIGPGAVVEGPLVFEREVKLYVHASARIGSVSGATARRYDTATPPRD